MVKYIFCLLVLSFVVYGETVEDLIKTATENNPRLKSIEYKLKAYKEKEVFEGSLKDPVVNFSINDIQLFYKPLSRTLEPMQTVNIGFSQSIPWLKKLKLKKEIVKTAYLSTLYKLEEEKLNIIYEIYKASFIYWQVNEKLKIIQDYKNVAKHLIDFSNTLYSVGKVSQTEVFNAYAFYSKLLTKEEKLKEQKRRTISRLEYLTYSKFNTLKVNTGKPEDISGLENYLNLAYLKNPTILKLKSKLEESQKKIKLAKLEYKPDFKFFANYSYRQEFRDYVSFGVSFNIPMWKKYRQDKKVLENVYLSKKVNKEVEDIKNKVGYEIEDTFYKLSSSYKTYSILEKYLLPQTQKVYESVISEYQVGKKNIFDVLTALNQILDVKLKLVEETMEFNIAYKKLMKLTGELK